MILKTAFQPISSPQPVPGKQVCFSASSPAFPLPASKSLPERELWVDHVFMRQMLNWLSEETTEQLGLQYYLLRKNVTPNPALGKFAELDPRYWLKRAWRRSVYHVIGKKLDNELPLILRRRIDLALRQALFSELKRQAGRGIQQYVVTDESDKTFRPEIKVQLKAALQQQLQNKNFLSSPEYEETFFKALYDELTGYLVLREDHPGIPEGDIISKYNLEKDRSEILFTNLKTD